MAFLLNFLDDLVKLKLPVTAGAVAATILGLISPFGIDVGPIGPILTGALVIVGFAAELVRRYRGERRG